MKQFKELDLFGYKNINLETCSKAMEIIYRRRGSLLISSEEFDEAFESVNPIVDTWRGFKDLLGFKRNIANSNKSPIAWICYENYKFYPHNLDQYIRYEYIERVGIHLGIPLRAVISLDESTNYKEVIDKILYMLSLADHIPLTEIIRNKSKYNELI